jgi:hypothetical protein
MENGGIKGVNFFKKQSLKDKKDADCFVVRNTIPATSAECFPANSSFNSGVPAIVMPGPPRGVLLVVMRRMTIPSIFHENEKLHTSLLEIWKDSNDNLIESNEIIENSVALREKELT